MASQNSGESSPMGGAARNRMASPCSNFLRLSLSAHSPAFQPRRVPLETQTMKRRTGLRISLSSVVLPEPVRPAMKMCSSDLISISGRKDFVGELGRERFGDHLLYMVRVAGFNFREKRPGKSNALLQFFFGDGVQCHRQKCFRHGRQHIRFAEVA